MGLPQLVQPSSSTLSLNSSSSSSQSYPLPRLPRHPASNKSNENCLTPPISEVTNNPESGVSQLPQSFTCTSTPAPATATATAHIRTESSSLIENLIQTSSTSLKNSPGPSHRWRKVKTISSNIQRLKLTNLSVRGSNIIRDLPVALPSNSPVDFSHQSISPSTLPSTDKSSIRLKGSTKYYSLSPSSQFETQSETRVNYPETDILQPVVDPNETCDKNHQRSHTDAQQTITISRTGSSPPIRDDNLSSSYLYCSRTADSSLSAPNLDLSTHQIGSDLKSRSASVGNCSITSSVALESCTSTLDQPFTLQRFPDDPWRSRSSSGSGSALSSPRSSSIPPSSPGSISSRSASHRSVMSHYTFGLSTSRDGSTTRTQKKQSDNIDYTRLHQTTPRSSPRMSNRPSTAPTISSMGSPPLLSPRSRLSPPTHPPISLILSDSACRSQLFRALVEHSQPQALNLLILLLDLITIIRGHTSQTDWDLFDRAIPSPRSHITHSPSSSKSFTPSRASASPSSPSRVSASPSTRHHLVCVRPGTSDGISSYQSFVVSKAASPHHKRANSGLQSSPLKPSDSFFDPALQPATEQPLATHNPWISHLLLLYCKSISSTSHNVPLNLPLDSPTYKALNSALDNAQDQLAPSMGFSSLKEVGRLACNELSNLEHVQMWWKQNSGLISLWPSVHFPTPSLSQLYQVSQKYHHSSKSGQIDNPCLQSFRTLVGSLMKLYLLEPSLDDLSGIYKLYPSSVQSATPSPSPPPLRLQTSEILRHSPSRVVDSLSLNHNSFSHSEFGSLSSNYNTSHSSYKAGHDAPFPNLQHIPQSASSRKSLKSFSSKTHLGSKNIAFASSGSFSSREATPPISPLDKTYDSFLLTSRTIIADGPNNRRKSCNSDGEDGGPPRKRSSTATIDAHMALLATGRATGVLSRSTLFYYGRVCIRMNKSCDQSIESKIETMAEGDESSIRISTDRRSSSSSLSTARDDEIAAVARAVKRQTKLQKILGEPISSSLTGYAGLGVTVVTEVVVENRDSKSELISHNNISEVERFHHRKHLSEAAFNRGMIAESSESKSENGVKSSRKHTTTLLEPVNQDQQVKSPTALKLGLGRRKLGNKIQKFLGEVGHINQSSHGNALKLGYNSTHEKAKVSESKEIKNRASKLKLGCSSFRECNSHDQVKDLCSRKNSSESMISSLDSVMNESFSGKSIFGNSSSTSYSSRSTKKLEKLFGEQIPRSNSALNSPSSNEDLQKNQRDIVNKYRNSLEILSEYCFSDHKDGFIKAGNTSTMISRSIGMESDVDDVEEKPEDQRHADDKESYDEQAMAEERESNRSKFGEEDEFESTIKAIERVIEKDHRLGAGERSAS
ncbi:expressed protein [Phakopsora pachyrhizi]|uniref:Expressed protein n=1 Tax=Phakopsora pachyrhizi TaxID=170000 RepID=A0AAV0BIX0_PHAPC|nr:expressed protein [Phakopsora pachyrhizi]